MTILVSGAGGKTGQAVTRALSARGQTVRAFVRRPEQVAKLRALGAREFCSGDMADEVDLQKALKGVQSVYLICPNVHPQEYQMAVMMIQAAQRVRVPRLVYHSVLHPQIEKMPHHWQKLRVEEALFESSLDFTILQPAPYMQNLLGQRDALLNEGVFEAPYSPGARLSLIDLNDAAEAAAVVLLEEGHIGATYELAGTAGLTQLEVAAVFSTALGREVRVNQLSALQWRERHAAALSDYALDALTKMFHYYDTCGLWSSPGVLAWLLRRPPGSLEDFILTSFHLPPPRFVLN